MRSQSEIPEEKEILEILKDSGYEEDIIKKALKQTKSRDIDEIIGVINDLERQISTSTVQKVNSHTNSYSKEEAEGVLKVNKEKILAEKMYREELIRRYKAEKRIKDEENRRFLEKESATTVKAVQLQFDCVFHIRFPDAHSCKMYFSKNERVNDLFKKIEAEYGSGNFTLYKMRDPIPIERSDDLLEKCSKIYPKAVLFIE